MHPQCRTESGIHDMHGNVKEWVGLGPDDAGIVGGSWFSGDSARCTYWKDDIRPEDSEDVTLGFRCCDGPVEERGDAFAGGRVGDQLMSFTGDELLGDGTFDSSVLAGKTVVLTFWASWCGPCRAELPVLQNMYRRLRSQGVEIVGINVDRDTQKGREMAREFGLTFPQIADPSQELMDRFDTRGLPTAFWIDARGNIRSRTTGFDAEAGEEGVMEHLQPLL